ncbi:unnamed protein product [Ixodes persulcatus]
MLESGLCVHWPHSLWGKMLILPPRFPEHLCKRMDRLTVKISVLNFA